MTGFMAIQEIVAAAPLVFRLCARGALEILQAEIIAVMRLFLGETPFPDH